MNTSLLLRQAAPLTTRRPFGSETRQRRRALRVRAEESFQAAPKAPKGVTQPKASPELPPATFGFVENAERLNSRAAMIGFFALIALEAILGKGLLETIGLTVGQGLPFEI